MSIVERLREESEHDPDSHESILFREAADEIERLRAELSDLVTTELRNKVAVSQAKEEELREALDLLWANTNHEEWYPKSRSHFERLIGDEND